VGVVDYRGTCICRVRVIASSTFSVFSLSLLVVPRPTVASPSNALGQNQTEQRPWCLHVFLHFRLYQWNKRKKRGAKWLHYLMFALYLLFNDLNFFVNNVKSWFLLKRKRCWDMVFPMKYVLETLSCRPLHCQQPPRSQQPLSLWWKSHSRQSNIDHSLWKEHHTLSHWPSPLRHCCCYHFFDWSGWSCSVPQLDLCHLQWLNWHFKPEHPYLTMIGAYQLVVQVQQYVHSSVSCQLDWVP